jgi:hypothetical protein
VRKTALLCSLGVAVLAAGAFAFAAAGGNSAPALDVSKTARATSVHYSVLVRLVKHEQPFVLHISGGASRDRVAVHLQLGSLKLQDGTRLPGTTGAIMLDKPFLYERAPGGIAVNGLSWLRLRTTRMPQDSQTLSTVRALTPSPLVHVIQEATLRPAGNGGWYAGTAVYDDPVVMTALDKLGGGLQYRNLHVAVLVRRDGLIQSVRITGRTADGTTTLSLRASLYGYGAPVNVVPPKPGTFMDQQLSRLQS